MPCAHAQWVAIAGLWRFSCMTLGPTYRFWPDPVRLRTRHVESAYKVPSIYDVHTEGVRLFSSSCSSQDLCARAHTHSLERSLPTTPQFSKQTDAAVDRNKSSMTWSIGWKLQTIHKFTDYQSLDRWESIATTKPRTGGGRPKRSDSVSEWQILRKHQPYNCEDLSISIKHLSTEFVD